MDRPIAVNGRALNMRVLDGGLLANGAALVRSPRGPLRARRGGGYYQMELIGALVFPSVK